MAVFPGMSGLKDARRRLRCPYAPSDTSGYAAGHVLALSLSGRNPMVGGGLKI